MYKAYRGHKQKYPVRVTISIGTILLYFFLMLNPTFLSGAVNDLPYASRRAGDIISAATLPSSVIDLSNTLSVKQDLNNITYIVQEGDTLNAIAKKYNVSIDSVKEYNGLSDNSLTPGQPLFVSKSIGILYELQENITIGDFARKYDLDLQTIKADNFITDETTRFFEGDQIMLPLPNLRAAYEKGLLSCEQAYNEEIITRSEAIQEGCEQETYTPPSSVAVTQSPVSVVPNGTAVPNRDLNLVGGTSSRSGAVIKQYYQRLPYNGRGVGHCTQYAAANFFPNGGVNFKPRRGNAKYWLANAAAAGYDTGTTPVIGSVVSMYLPASSYWSGYGHVAVVEDIDRANKRVLISEMNYRGLNVVTRRRIPFNAAKGYIYKK